MSSKTNRDDSNVLTSPAPCLTWKHFQGGQLGITDEVKCGKTKNGTAIRWRKSVVKELGPRLNELDSEMIEGMLSAFPEYSPEAISNLVAVNAELSTETAPFLANPCLFDPTPPATTWWHAIMHGNDNSSTTSNVSTDPLPLPVHPQGLRQLRLSLSHPAPILSPSSSGCPANTEFSVSVWKEPQVSLKTMAQPLSSLSTHECIESLPLNSTLIITLSAPTNDTILPPTSSSSLEHKSDGNSSGTLLGVVVQTPEMLARATEKLLQSSGFVVQHNATPEGARAPITPEQQLSLQTHEGIVAHSAYTFGSFGVHALHPIFLPPTSSSPSSSSPDSPTPPSPLVAPRLLVLCESAISRYCRYVDVATDALINGFGSLWSKELDSVLKELSEMVIPAVQANLMRMEHLAAATLSDTPSNDPLVTTSSWDSGHPEGLMYDAFEQETRMKSLSHLSHELHSSIKAAIEHRDGSALQRLHSTLNTSRSVENSTMRMTLPSEAKAMIASFERIKLRHSNLGRITQTIANLYASCVAYVASLEAAAPNYNVDPRCEASLPFSSSSSSRGSQEDDGISGMLSEMLSGGSPAQSLISELRTARGLLNDAKRFLEGTKLDPAKTRIITLLDKQGKTKSGHHAPVDDDYDTLVDTFIASVASVPINRLTDMPHSDTKEGSPEDVSTETLAESSDSTKDASKEFKWPPPHPLDRSPVLEDELGPLDIIVALRKISEKKQASSLLGSTKVPCAALGLPSLGPTILMNGQLSALDKFVDDCAERLLGNAVMVGSVFGATLAYPSAQGGLGGLLGSFGGASGNKDALRDALHGYQRIVNSTHERTLAKYYANTPGGLTEATRAQIHSIISNYSTIMSVQGNAVSPVAQDHARKCGTLINGLLLGGFGYVSSDMSSLVGLLDSNRAFVPLDDIRPTPRFVRRAKDVARLLRRRERDLADAMNRTCSSEEKTSPVSDAQSKGFSVRISYDMDAVLKGLRLHHKDSWVSNELALVWYDLFLQGKLITFELYLGDKLIAADLGHPIGRIFYVATRFVEQAYRMWQPGFILALAELKILKDNGFLLWDLGGVDGSGMMGYKLEIANVEQRALFLHRFRRIRALGPLTKKVPLPKESGGSDDQLYVHQPVIFPLLRGAIPVPYLTESDLVVLQPSTTDPGKKKKPRKGDLASSSSSQVRVGETSHGGDGEVEGLGEGEGEGRGSGAVITDQTRLARIARRQARRTANANQSNNEGN